MSWWNACYTNGCEEHTIRFGSNSREKVKAVEAVCQAVIDKKVLGPEDVGVVVRCKDCKYFDTQSMECQCDYVSTDHEGGASYSINFGPDDFCSFGERRTQ